MTRHRPQQFAGGLNPRMLVLCLFLVLGAGAQSNPLSLCSPQNTGEKDTQQFSIYNSFGSCTGHCAGYAFAIMLGKNCWCSNVAPESTADTDECSDSCPGYESDKCGNIKQGLYAYAQLALASSTLESSSSSSSTSTSSSESSTSSIISTSSSTSSSESSSSSSSSSTPASTSSISHSESTNSSSSSAFVTTSGSSYSISSLTTSSSTPNSSISLGSQKTKKGFWNDSGAVAGTFVAVGIVALALMAAILYTCIKRNKMKNMLISRNAKLNEEYGSKRDSDPQSHSHTKSSLSGLSDQDLKLVPIFDQRLDPTQFYMQWERNGSNTSLQDNEDYSRRLRVANPNED